MTPFRIIYVEDSSADAELLKRALIQMLPQADLLHFRDAETAQQFFSETASTGGEIDLAIIDIKLPGMPGDKLIAWLRTQAAFQQLPTIALSGARRFDTIAEAQAIGATSFFVKPVVYNDYIDLVYLIQDTAT
jgi:DNA-binding response OmpR family regulator